MILYENIVQGTPEWNALRLSVPTASRFAEILTPSTLKPSASMDKYVLQKVAEWSLGVPCDSAKSAFMRRGTEMEPEAVARYEWESGLPVQRVGFVTTDDGLVGASPDGLVGADGLLEIKILSAENHLEALTTPPDPKEHKAQIQGQLYVCERLWCDRFYYHPTYPCLIVRIGRDETYITALHEAIYGPNGFNERLEKAKAALVEKGFNASQALCRQCKSRDGLENVEGVGVLCGACREAYARADAEIFGT